YCIDKSDDFSKSAIKKGYKSEYLSKVGLIKVKDDRTFDFYRGRVIFPIHSISGRVLGFGGRTLKSDKKVAKYYNSPESPIYNKSEILYGLYFSKGEIIKRDECFLCEGYTDVISLYQSGIQNVVSSSGTSLTKEQVRLVKRYTQNLTILYDGDAAGIKASFRGIDIILEEGLNVKVVMFPDGEDPDSFAKKSSLNELTHMIEENKQDFISFKASVLMDGIDNDPIKKSKLIRDVLESVSLIPDQITRSVYVQEIAKKFDIEERTISNELIKVLRSKASKSNSYPSHLEEVHTSDIIKKSSEARVKVSTNDEYELDLIRFMVLFGTKEMLISDGDDTEEKSCCVIELICDEISKDDLTFNNEQYRVIYEMFEKNLQENVLLTASHLKKLENQKIVSFVSNIESSEIELSHNWIQKYNIYTKSESDNIYKSVMNSVYNFKYHKVDELLAKVKKEIQESASGDEELLSLLGEQMSYERVKKKLSDKLGRIILK
ncbi:toprim domain-containing protein, partial [bacterium]|nr:toprim domain-containing protein [bacterium]